MQPSLFPEEPKPIPPVDSLMEHVVSQLPFGYTVAITMDSDGFYAKLWNNLLGSGMPIDHGPRFTVEGGGIETLEATLLRLAKTAREVAKAKKCHE